MKSTFLSEYLLLGNFKTVLFLIILIATFFVNKKMQVKNINFTFRMIASIAMGVTIGILIQFLAGFPEIPSDISWVKEVTSWYGFFGSGFMDLLKMIVVPIVFISIVKLIINMKGKNLGKLTIKTIVMLMITTIISAAIGVIVANIFNIGTDMQMISNSEEQLREVTTIVKTLRDLIPSNPFAAMVNANVVGVIIFAAFIGFATRRINEKQPEVVEVFIKWVEGAYSIINSIAMTIIKFMPYAVTALMANTIASNGLSSVIVVMDFTGALYISVAIMFVIHLIIISMNGINPIKYIKNAFEPIALAFTSRSSLGTMPVTVETLIEKFKIDEGTATLTASLGANMGMNGCAGIYPALAVVTIANMLGINMDISFYVMLMIVIAISSLGIAGIPGTATIALALTLSGMGMGEYFPLLGGIIAIDPILDMGRTMLNVNGAIATAITVSNK